MADDSCDIFISGGGVAGLAAAAVFGAAGLSVTVADPAPPVTDAGSDGADLRTTAFLRPARDLLVEAGLWARLEADATPLKVMRIVDAGGARTVPRVSRDFDAATIGEPAFGWNLPNWLLRRELAARLDELPGVDFRPGVGFRGLLARDDAALVTLSDGARLRARLVVGADGRDSPVREASGIGVRRVRYGQKAVVFAVTHSRPHDGVSTEVHRDGGPFTLVPLPDRDGLPCSSVVWMVRGPEAARLMALGEAAFAAEATDRSAGALGPLTPVGRRQAWPIVSQMANALTARRVALVAEAAHVVPPIGAQGLNMSLEDVSTLRDLALARPEGLGEREMLDAYARRRHPEIAARLAGVDLLNRASMAGAPPLTALRAAGLAALHDVRPVRQALMRLGLGALGRR
ncbi:UbiH/UbiF family hydroxylase [Wenxinia marina]|nr:UbiH/UbiF family hydroxylase [Wenxinia marina]